MIRIIYLAYFLVSFFINPALGQVDEHVYFYHPQYFNDSIIFSNSIKKIKITRFWVDTTGISHKTDLTEYDYNKKGDLVCAQFYHFDNKKIKRQTIDCYEYSNQGLQTKHLRYHNSKDSAEWVQKYHYVMDDFGNVLTFEIKDFTNPRNSSLTSKFYDSNNRLIKTVTNNGYVTEYKYDQNGNLIEKKWRLNEDNWNRYSYKYDRYRNIVYFRFTGTPFDNFSTIETSIIYDEIGRLIEKQTVNAEGIRTKVLYFYSKNEVVKKEYYDSNNQRLIIEKEIYRNGLVKMKTLEMDGFMHSKEIFEYQYFKN